LRRVKNFMSDEGRGTVTVVIVNWNSGALLADCLEHLLAQTLPPTRIVVLDNDSTDGSMTCADRFPSVNFRFLGENLGFAVANNLAVAEADTEFVALLNPDANPEPDWLERLLAAALDDPQVVAFGSRQMMHEPPTTIDGLGDIYHVSGLTWRRGFGRQLDGGDLESREVFSACGAAVLYRREDFLRAGGFDETFFCYCEDVDLGFRFLLAGKRCLYVADAVVEHRGASCSGGHRSAFSVYHGHRNLVWTFIKDVPAPLFWLLLPLHLLQNVVVVACFILRGQGRTILRSKWDAIKGIPAVWRKRQLVQAQRAIPVKAVWAALDRRVIPRDRLRIRKALKLSA
jgi:GT2 family glycosyltransferase